MLAAGAEDKEALRRCLRLVGELERQMDAGRRSRLVKLGFAPEDAERSSDLHTRKFM